MSLIPFKSFKMASRLTLLLLIQSCSCIDLPLIIIDYTGTICHQTSGNPFKVMPISTFAYIIHDAMYRSENVLVFIEQEFSMEDISSRDDFGSPYYNLHAMYVEKTAKFISRVTNPYTTLRENLPANSTTVTILRENRDYIRIDKDIKFHFIHFNEPDDYLAETRVERLRRHDSIIKQTYKNLIARRSGLVVVFYTGMSRRRLTERARHVPEPASPPSDVNMMVTDQALIRLTGVKLQQGTKRTPLVQPRAATRRYAMRTASTGVVYDANLELDFNFEYLKDGWVLENIVLMEGGEEVGRKAMGIGAPYGYSYFCSEPLYIVNNRDKSYISISKYQVEPQPTGRLRALMMDEAYKDNSNANEIAAIITKVMAEALKSINKTTPLTLSSAFSDMIESLSGSLGKDFTLAILKDLKLIFTEAVTCGTNFNCHILAGLFVAFIVMSIGASGIMVLFDCKSNDRMDDPNQKPLVIVAQL